MVNNKIKIKKTPRELCEHMHVVTTQKDDDQECEN